MGDRTVDLFRYDNVGDHGGPERHHCHRFDEAGREILPPTTVSADAWPTLGDVIDEAQTWWENREP